MDPVIFLEKVRRPALRGLVRERLDRRTASLTGVGTDPVSLALVLGPPGSGKTTLLSHAAEAASASAWYRAGTEDDDEVALTRHVGHTLGAALGVPGVIESAATGRVADLVRALDDPTVTPVQLIIDDLHEITGTPAERALESFLSLRPRKIRIMLGSRRPPQINTSRLLVSGELTQLDGEDLRFRSWEVEELFRAVYDAPLSPEAAAALTRRTGGWAAGLQLFHLATAQLNRADRERAVDELSGRSRLIRSYLARNVLDGLDPDRRRFLLLTSTLGVLTGDLCDDLLDTSGSAAVLAELEREQFFTTSTDAGLTYHYHQVLQTHLEVLLVDELGGRAARELYSRSAGLLEHAGRPAAAIRAHARAEDWGSVGRLLKPDATPVTGDDALWGVLPLPGAPTDDPGLVLAGARRLARDGQVAESITAFRHAETLLDDPEFRRRCTVERSAAATWLPQAGIPPIAPREDLAHAAILRLSLELRHVTREVRDPDAATRPLVRAVAMLLTGDLAAAARQLRRADPAPGSAAAAWEPLALRLTARIVDLLNEPGEIVAGQVEEIVLSADVHGWPWLSRIARGLQAAVLLAAAPAPWRVSAATELLDDLERQGDRWTVCLTSLAIGAVYAHLELPELATRTLRRAEEVAAELGAPVLRVWASVLRTAVAVRVGEPSAEQQATAALRTAAGLGVSHASTVVERIAQIPSPVPGRTPTGCGRPPRRDRSDRILGGDAALPGWFLARRCGRRTAVARAAAAGPRAVDAAGDESRSSPAPRAAGRRAVAGRHPHVGCPQPAGGGVQHPAVPGAGRDHRGRAAPTRRRVRAAVPGGVGPAGRLRAARPPGRTGERGRRPPAAIGGAGGVHRGSAARGRPGGMGGRGAGPAPAAGGVGRLGSGPRCTGRRATARRVGCSPALGRAGSLPRLVLAVGGRDQRTARGPERRHGRSARSCSGMGRSRPGQPRVE